MEAERLPGERVAKRWWENQELSLEGARGKNIYKRTLGGLHHWGERQIMGTPPQRHNSESCNYPLLMYGL